MLRFAGLCEYMKLTYALTRYVYTVGLQLVPTYTNTSYSITLNYINKMINIDMIINRTRLHKQVSYCDVAIYYRIRNQRGSAASMLAAQIKTILDTPICL